MNRKIQLFLLLHVASWAFLCAVYFMHTVGVVWLGLSDTEGCVFRVVILFLLAAWLHHVLASLKASYRSYGYAYPLMQSWCGFAMEACGVAAPLSMFALQAHPAYLAPGRLEDFMALVARTSVSLWLVYIMMRVASKIRGY